MISARIKQLSYLVQPRPWALEKPVVIQFPVIDICNSQCQMCRIWENKKSNDIKPDELRRGLRNPLFSEVSTVGLNGGEPTLRKDLGVLARVLFEELKSLRTISLITNAYRYREVIERIKELGAIAKEYNAHFDVMVSLDGYRGMHDLVRGKPGNFERAEKVLDFIQSSDLVSNTRIGCTMIKANVYGLHDLFDYCVERKIYVKYRLGIPHQRLYTQDLKDPYALTLPEKVHIAEFLEGLIRNYEPAEQQQFFYRSLIDQIIHQAPRKAGCDWQHRGATITSKGELLYCAVQSKPLGLIQKDDSLKAYFDNQPHLRQIIDTKCDTCNHDYVGIMPPRANFQRMLNKASKKITAMGLPGVPYVKEHARSALQQHRYTTHQRALGRLGQEAAADARAVAREPSSIPEILICGWYGTETLGDKAILAGLVNLLRESAGNCKISLVSLNAYISEMTVAQMPELSGIEILSVAEGIVRARSARLTIFGGGPLMAIDPIADMGEIFRSAKAAGNKTLVCGCGVGPLGTSYRNKGILDLLRSADIRIYRDSKSMKTAETLGLTTSNNTDFVAEDPAFTWLSRNGAISHPVVEDERKTLVLGLREFPAHEYAGDVPASVVEQWNQNFESNLLIGLKALVEECPDLRILPLPMCTNHFGNDDRWYYRRLFRSEPSLSKSLDYSLLNRELSPLEYLIAFRSASAVVAMRFHSLVFALGASVPVVAVDYTIGRGKVGALADRAGVPCWSYDKVEGKTLFEEIQKLLSSPPRPGAPFPVTLPHLIGPLVQKLLT